MIVLAGTIGAGKTSLTQMLADHLGSKPFFESVDDNPILPLFRLPSRTEVRSAAKWGNLGHQGLSR